MKYFIPREFAFNTLCKVDNLFQLKLFDSPTLNPHK